MATFFGMTVMAALSRMRIGVLLFGAVLAIALVDEFACASSTIAGVTITPDLRRVIVRFEGRTVGTDGLSVYSKPNSLEIDVSAARLGQVERSTRAGRGEGLEVRVAPAGSGARLVLDFGKSRVPNYRVRWLGSYLTVFLGEWAPGAQPSPNVTDQKTPREGSEQSPPRRPASNTDAVALQKERKSQAPPPRPKKVGASRAAVAHTVQKNTPPATVTIPPERPAGSEVQKPVPIAPKTESHRPESVPYPVHATAIPATSPASSARTGKEEPFPPPLRDERKPAALTPHSNRMSVTTSEKQPLTPVPSAGKKTLDGPLTATYLVFVYGSDMNHSGLMDWLEANGYDSATIIGATPAVLDGYDFVWNYYSRDRAGGAVNVEPHANSRVYGLLIEFDESLLGAFDRKAGHPRFYARKETRVAVRRLDNGNTSFAWLYTAKPNRRGRRDVWPTEDYKNTLIEAARFWELPPEHLDKMSAWHTQ